MTNYATSYMPTPANADVTRKADDLLWVLPMRPQALSIYLRFIEKIDVATEPTFSKLLAFADASFNAPRLFAQTVSGVYRFAWTNTAGTERSSIMSVATSPGDCVELLGTLTDTGSIQITWSINGGATASAAASAAQSLPTAWSGNRLQVGNSDALDQPWATMLRNLLITRGVNSLETMRRFAGV